MAKSLSSYSYHKINTLYQLVLFTINLAVFGISHVESRRSLSTIQGPHYEFGVVGVVALPGTMLYGGQAAISVWKPFVSREKDFSTSFIRILLNDDAYMQAGWIVYPERYGDYKPRLYIYWTADSGVETGCYDLDCDGFQLVDEASPLGQPIQPISVVGAATWIVIDVQIYQIPSSGDWQLNVGGKPLGLWPASLFSSAPVGAKEVEMGGSVFDSIGNSQHTSTNMGNGLFPNIVTRDASSICSIEYVDALFTRRTPDRDMLVSYVTNPFCYDAQLLPVTDTENGVCFLFGGNGRNPECP